MKARIDKSSCCWPKRMFHHISHDSQPLAASSKGGPFTERFTMKQRASPIINIIEQPSSSSLIYFLNSCIESLSVLQKGDNVGFLSLRLSNLEILKTTLQNDKRNIFTTIFICIRNIPTYGTAQYCNPEVLKILK